MVVTGPVAFRVGAFALVALPLGDKLPDTLPEPVCSRALVAHPYRDAPVSSVTLLPPALAIGESFDRNASYVLSLESARGIASLRLAALDLELGVLVGRAPKCSDKLRQVLNDGISRVHLLIRKGIVYDLASTQGTYVPDGGHGWRRVRWSLLEEGSDVFIGAVNAVRMRFRKLDS
jgi:hypothetical protein